MPLVDVVLDVDSIHPPLTGIGRYAFELARGLAASQEIGNLRLIKRHRFVDDLDALLGHSSPNDSPKGRVSARAVSKDSAFQIAKRTIGRLVLPGVKYWRTRSLANHIYHSPNYALPPFPGKRVSTIHDLSVFRYPEFHPSERVAHMRRIFPRILRCGDLFLTDSEFSRQEILDTCGVEADRVISIPLGVDGRYRPMDRGTPSPALRSLGLIPGRYSLSVGTVEPRKNIARLIQAYRSLPLNVRTEYPLVLAGGEGWNSVSIHEQIKMAQGEGWLKYLSYVAESDLPALYAGARVFACVSLYEGFGLPVLEAMAAGVPVISSNVASLPEVGGSAVRYVDPLQSDTIRQALIELLNDEGVCQSYREAGLLRARQFTWARTVESTVAAYQRLI